MSPQTHSLGDSRWKSAPRHRILVLKKETRSLETLLLPTVGGDPSMPSLSPSGLGSPHKKTPSRNSHRNPPP